MNLYQKKRQEGMKFKAAARHYNMNVPEDMKARIVVLIDVVVRNCKLLLSPHIFFLVLISYLRD